MDRNGKIIGGCIAVDLWTTEALECNDYRDPNESGVSMGPITSSQIRLFFLSHLHADHTMGLNNGWCRGPIYTSPLNAKLAPKLIPNLTTTEKLFVPLELDTPHLIPLGDSDNDPKVRVTLIDANHVPGAVMFVFRGYFGNILYTGDFRYCESMLNNPSLNQLERWEDIDKLYLDNTYFFSKCTFATRSEVVKKLISFLRQHESYHVYFGARKLGKEDAFVQIAMDLKERICIDESRMDIFRALELPDVFTTDAQQARLFVVPQKMVTKNFLESENMKRPTIGVWLTALFYNWDDSPYKNCEVWDLNIFEYSDHSSYPEIIKFIQRVKPKQVIPIVGVSKYKNNWLSRRQYYEKERNDMTSLQPYLSTLPSKYFGYEKPKIVGLPPTISGTKYDLLTSAKTNNSLIPKPMPKRIYRGPKGPVYESSNTATTIGSSNNTSKCESRVAENESNLTNNSASFSPDCVTNELSVIASNNLDNEKNKDCENITKDSGLLKKKRQTKDLIVPQKRNISNISRSNSSTHNSLKLKKNKNCKGSDCDEKYDSFLKVVKISENNVQKVCYVDTSPNKYIKKNSNLDSTGVVHNLKKSSYLSKKPRHLENKATNLVSNTNSDCCNHQNLDKGNNEDLPRSILSSNGHACIPQLSKNISDSANFLLSKEFKQCIKEKDCSVLHTIDLNLSSVQGIISKKN